MRCIDSSDTRHQIVTVRYGFYIITIASEYRSCIALEIERQGGFGFQRESRARKSCALGQVADNRLGYIKGNSSKRLFCFGQTGIRKLSGILVKVDLRIRAVVEQGFYQRRGFREIFSFIGMCEQIVGIFLDGIGELSAMIFTVDDLRLDIGGHFLRGYLTFKDIVGLIAGLNGSCLGYLDILCIGFAVLRDSKVHISCFTLCDSVGQLHIEIHADIADKRDRMTDNSCAEFIGIINVGSGIGLAPEFSRYFEGCHAGGAV